MRAWLSLFIVTPDKFILDLININLTKLFGYTYCITSPIINGIKIGFWTGTISGLESRYKTYYGQDIELYFVPTLNPYELEQKCMKHFSKYKISGELFEKKYLNKYQIYLENNKM